MGQAEGEPKERERRCEEHRAWLSRATEELLTSEGRRRQPPGPLHSYSVRNTLLIA